MRLARLALAPAVLSLLCVAAQGSLFTIVPTFDPTITTDPNAAGIEGVINTAINTYEADFKDPITVNITFAEMNSGLGMSSTAYGNTSYSNYLTQITLDAKTPDDFIALNHLPSLSEFSTTFGTSNISIKTANARAVGFSAPVASDGTVSLNTHLTFPGSPGTSSQYSLLAVTEHEIDEVLGLGSALPAPPSGNPFPEDLFRYTATPHLRSYTPSTSGTAFFSIDGTTDLAEFNNQQSGADFGDWRSNPLPSGAQPKVQDAFATPGAPPALSVELRALDVIGYDLSIPEPATGFLAASALAIFFNTRRLARKRTIA